jgi:prepilin-type N-terminal cleavage/methylation domain-containing protein
MKNPRNTTQKGASVVEMLIVLAVLGIIVTFAVMQYGRSRENFTRQNIAREFKVYLERARFDSVRRRANTCNDMSSVTINSSTSFSVSIDRNQNGTVERPDETSTIDFSGPNNVTVVGNGLTLPVTIRFDERGRAFLRSDCDPSSLTTATVPLFYFCNGTCTAATATDDNANAIFISPAGTVAMMSGSSTMPTFSDPTVTNVAVGTGIDNRLTVWTGTPPTPTPGASSTPATPTPLPSVSPTTSPSGSPSGTPTPTPTPIRACTYGEKPRGNPPSCKCYLPMYQDGSGKCIGMTPTPTP